ncbi:MAG TPA: hypothetical protein VLW17_08485 [Thermoanaerobaculaceae bacterium]|nr:hypothetical protein [Thermoanaerobaculaceae bacterium]
MRRALAAGTVVTAGAASVVTWAGKPWSAVALTMTAAVAMINGLWLEGLLATVLQPGRPRVTRGAVSVLAARYGLWGLLFVALYALRARIELWAVAVGIGCFLVALAAAGLKSDAGVRGEEKP